MSTPPLDLKGLLNYILKNKDVKARVDLNVDCIVSIKDPKPLIKIINYVLNYLKKITKESIDISLKKQSNGCLLCFIVSTDLAELPPLSDKLDEALKLYNGALRLVFERAKYAQILICFNQDKIPESVIIEV